MYRSIVSIFFLCLLLITGYVSAAVKINPVKVYEVGVKAYESEDYKQAILLFEDAIEKGLSGERRTYAHLKLCKSASIFNDLKRIEYYLPKCIRIISHFEARRKKLEMLWKENIDPLLSRRCDLIARSLQVLQKSGGVESNLAENFNEGVSKVRSVTKIKEKIEANNHLSSLMAHLLLAVERYPEIKASSEFILLQDELVQTENRIAVQRKLYNDAALEYNNWIEQVLVDVEILEPAILWTLPWEKSAPVKF